MNDDLYMSAPNSKSVEAFIEGMTILSKYHKDGLQAKFAFGGEHDIVHIWLCDLEACPEDSEDGLRLAALGFSADDDLDQWQWFT